MVYNLIRQDNLSEGQKAILFEYHQLSSQTKLSHDDIYRLSTIWQMAESDLTLTKALSFIDAFHASNTDGQSLAEDKDLRAFLSEHISVIAEERWHQLNGNQEELKPSGHITLLCPDGSGFVSINLEPGKPMSLSGVLDKVCGRCNTKLSEHQDFIVLGERSMSPTS